MSSRLFTELLARLWILLFEMTSLDFRYVSNTSKIELESTVLFTSTGMLYFARVGFRFMSGIFKKNRP